jgi:hypothetical protein
MKLVVPFLLLFLFLGSALAKDEDPSTIMLDSTLGDKNEGEDEKKADRRNLGGYGYSYDDDGYDDDDDDGYRYSYSYGSHHGYSRERAYTTRSYGHHYVRPARVVHHEPVVVRRYYYNYRSGSKGKGGSS